MDAVLQPEKEIARAQNLSGSAKPGPKAGYVTEDSGERQEFDTGARRDLQIGKGRFDLVMPELILRLAQLLERGAKKYGDHNWTKGIPASRYLSSLLRHAGQFASGCTKEDHLAAVVFNTMGLMDLQTRCASGELPMALWDVTLPPWWRGPCTD